MPQHHARTEIHARSHATHLCHVHAAPTADRTRTSSTHTRAWSFGSSTALPDLLKPCGDRWRTALVAAGRSAAACRLLAAALGLQQCYCVDLRVKGPSLCLCLSGYSRRSAVPARLPCSALARVRLGLIAGDYGRALPAGPCYASLSRAAASGRSPRRARSQEARAPGVTNTVSS